jgi:hypothetical protein
MKPIVFAGPSIAGMAPELLHGIDLRPPAACGDVARAAVHDRAKVIGLIDGVFETQASVWHKELLLALSKDVAVFGAASIGALRAVEMRPFGMRGIGLVYRLYAMNAIADDDEVALLHGPPETGCLPISEAMINVRATLRHARHRRIIDTHLELELAADAKRIFYKNRTWDRIFATPAAHRAAPAAARLRSELSHVKRDVKKEDAIKLVRLLSNGCASKAKVRAPEFQNTSLWAYFEDRHLSASPS